MSLALTEVDRTPLGFEAGSTLHIHQGTPLVVDRYEAQLVAVEPGKDLGHRWGSKGDGPGEFQSISAIVKAPDDGIWVLDVKRHVGILMSEDGRFIKELALPGLPMVVRARPGGGLEGLWLLGYDLFLGSVDGEDGRVLSRRDVAAALPSLLSDLPEVAAPMTGGAWTAAGTLLIGAPWRYELIEVQEDLTYVRRIARDLPRELPTEDDLAALRERLEATFKLASASFPESTIDQLIADKASEPKPPIVLSVIEVDPEGRIWVLTTRRADSASLVDVFSADGQLVATVALTGRPQAIAFDGDAAFVLTREASGVDVLVEYHVE